MSRRFLIGVLVVALGVNSANPAQAAQKEALVVQVRKAIDHGIQFLKDQERGTGSWEDNDRSPIRIAGGWTSLAMLALLNAGVKPDDPIIDRGLKYLRSVEPTFTYSVSLQTMVFAETGRIEDRERIQRNVDWLIRARVMSGGRCLGWTYQMGRGGFPDNSNTQYALLGLHAGHQAGAKIEREVWRTIRNFYIESQQPDGGWIYNPSFPGTPTLQTMTTAGLCGLLISGMELNAGRESIRDDGQASNCGRYAENKPIQGALGWISRNFRIELPYNTYYSLYGIERAGRLSGQRFLGGHDWYREGCRYLVDMQNKENGSWQGNERTRDSHPVVATSFALLFLSKGRTPVLISKMAHGPNEDWNNDRNDARRLVEYASVEVFQKTHLAWQVFDVRRMDIPDNDAILRIVQEDLLPSPILYFNGHQAPHFRDVEKKLLQQYVEQGGFLFAEACCGRKEFDAGFRELMKELFPDNPLRKLPPEHPIWKAHALVPPDAFPLEGIEYGCKTVVVYSPTDVSCLWESSTLKNARGQLAFRLGGNLIAYATGLEPPKPRLTEADVVRDELEGKEIPRGYLKVAQLRHTGDWQPAPNAMRNLLSHLRQTARLDVALQTRPLYATDKDLMDFKFLYMHGRGNFTLANEGIKNLRMDLESGGLLFADACCGKKAFDSAFHELTARLFPDKKLEPIPLNDDLYSKDLNGTVIDSVRCRLDTGGEAGQAGGYRDMPPQLEGIMLGKRWVVIYSKYDIGCALEKRQSTDCVGHDHESALRLGSAAVLYALKR